MFSLRISIGRLIKSGNESVSSAEGIGVRGCKSTSVVKGKLKMFTFVLIILGGLVATVVVQMSVTSEGRSLQQKFIDLGTLSGRSKDEIVESVGAPNAFSSLADGKALLQWQKPGYHIALIFDGDICEGVSHESAVN